MFQPSEFSGSCFHLGPLTSVERSRREIARCPRPIVPAPKASERCDAYARCDSPSESTKTPRKTVAVELKIAVCEARLSHDGPLSSGVKILIAVNRDWDRPGSVGMRVNVMRSTDVVQDPAPRFQQLTLSLAYTIAFQGSVSSPGCPNRLLLHSFMLGRQPTFRRFNGVGLGFLDCVAFGRAAQRRDHDGEAAVRLGEGDGL